YAPTTVATSDVIRISTILFCITSSRMLMFFFFQAEDGIRDSSVTGVQTCALPIWAWQTAAPSGKPTPPLRLLAMSNRSTSERTEIGRACVGKECRYRWSAYH